VIAAGSITALVGSNTGYEWGVLILIGLGVCGISYGVRLWLVKKQVIVSMT